MNPSVQLVLASTYMMPAECDGSNFYTFRITHEVKSIWRRLLGLNPKMRTVYTSAWSRWDLAQAVYPDGDERCFALAEALQLHMNVASDAFKAIHRDGRISNNTMRKAAGLWGLRLNDVLKIRKVGEFHIPTWDGINLTNDMAEATPDRGWVRTTRGEN
jgi:hypothetical protein